MSVLAWYFYVQKMSQPESPFVGADDQQDTSKLRGMEQVLLIIIIQISDSA
jgi:hypothetical protein